MSTQFPVGRSDLRFREDNFSSPYLSRRQTAIYLNVSEKWLAQGGRRSGPNYYKFGNNCRYHIDDLKSWAGQQEVKR